MEILGVTFNSWCSHDKHVENRINKSKRSMFSLSSVGMCYPGLDTRSKVHLFKTLVSPTLMYGLECVNVTPADIVKAQNTQGAIMKYVCGLS